MTLPRPKLLMVDDVEANLISLQAVLSDLPCELVLARSGNEALRALLKHEFALLLLDVQMPEMDGFEVASHLRSNARTRDLPIVFLTAMHHNEASALKGYGSGAVDFLVKPIDAAVLRSKVIVFLELYAKKRELAAALEAEQKATRELSRANEALRHFTQAASHDLGAPLRAIQGFLRGLDDEVGAGLAPTPKRYLDRSRNAAARMATLLESLLAYAELRRPAEPTQVNLNAIVERVASDLTPRIEQSKAELVVGELPVVRGDASRLYQLFLNLIGNALKFRRAELPPRIVISASRRALGEWLCSVEDNGVGIPPEHASTVFSAFKRLYSQDEYEGSGLGLAIVREVVEQHGGQIWVESELGRGARFCFTLKGDN
jgi:two-component system, sensor histidine kinase and response regulator